MNTMKTVSDPYSSRQLDSWEAVDREDPIVYGDRPGPLSQEQLHEYERNGFVVLPSLFTVDEVDTMLCEAQDLAHQWQAGEPGLVREPGSETVRSIFRLHQKSDSFRRVFSDQRLASAAQQLLGSDVTIHQSRINYKLPLDGKEFFWHSDFETWHVEDGMPRMRAVSASIFLTDSHEFNGPLMLVPGSHRKYIRCVGATPVKHFEQSLRRQEYGVPSREALEMLVDEGGIVAPKGPAGSVVLFECNTMHGSVGNLSPHPRINLFVVYNSVHNALQEPFGDRPPRPDYLAERQPFVVPAV